MYVTCLHPIRVFVNSYVAYDGSLYVKQGGKIALN